MLAKILSKEEANCFIDLVDVLDSSVVKFNLSIKLAEGIGKVMNKFISNEDFCERSTNLILSSMNEIESKVIHNELENKDSSFNYFMLNS